MFKTQSFLFKQIKLMSEIALIDPQAVYLCYVAGFQHKYIYYLRTIEGFEEFLLPLEETIRHYLLAAITGGHVVTDDERELPYRGKKSWEKKNSGKNLVACKNLVTFPRLIFHNLQ